jgi:hypothetical protein
MLYTKGIKEESDRQCCCLMGLSLLILFPLSLLYSQRERTPTGAFIERTFVSSTSYTLSWGNVRFKRSLPDKFSLGYYDNPKFDWENPQYICLRAECESDCWYAILLPMNEETDCVFYTRPLAFDTINNYVAFPGEKDTLVTIEHISTGNCHFLITWDRCGDQENYMCIRDVWFDPLRQEASITWLASGNVSHPEAYSTERTVVIPLHK